MTFKADQEVYIRSPSIAGEGVIKGKAGDLPIVGTLWIVHVTSSVEQLPNDIYPFEYITMPEIFLTTMPKNHKV